MPLSAKGSRSSRNSACAARKAFTWSSFSFRLIVQVPYTSSPPGRT